MSKNIYTQMPDEVSYENEEKIVNLLFLKGFLERNDIAETCSFEWLHIKSRVS